MKGAGMTFRPAVPVWSIGVGYTALATAAYAMFITGRPVAAAVNLVLLALFLVAVAATNDLYSPAHKEG